MTVFCYRARCLRLAYSNSVAAARLKRYSLSSLLDARSQVFPVGS